MQTRKAFSTLTIKLFLIPLCNREILWPGFCLASPLKLSKIWTRGIQQFGGEECMALWKPLGHMPPGNVGCCRPLMNQPGVAQMDYTIEDISSETSQNCNSTIFQVYVSDHTCSAYQRQVIDEKTCEPYAQAMNISHMSTKSITNI